MIRRDYKVQNQIGISTKVIFNLYSQLSSSQFLVYVLPKHSIIFLETNRQVLNRQVPQPYSEQGLLLILQYSHHQTGSLVGLELQGWALQGKQTGEQPASFVGDSHSPQSIVVSRGNTVSPTHTFHNLTGASIPIGQDRKLSIPRSKTFSPRGVLGVRHSVHSRHQTNVNSYPRVPDPCTQSELFRTLAFSFPSQDHCFP